MGAAFNETVDELARIARKHKGVKWGVLIYDILALPVALVLAVLLGHPLILMDTDDTSRWDTTEMPNDWLVRVASLPAISKKGLAFLHQAISKVGWLSIRQAIIFVHMEVAAAEREQAVEQQKMEADKRARVEAAHAAEAEAKARRINMEKAEKQSEGASLLLDRISRDLP